MYKFTLLCFCIIVCFAACGATQVSASSDVEASVREFFVQAPVMIEIARCESKFRQFADDGSVLRGGWNDGMVGVFQLYGSVHTRIATSLGYDIETLAGNLAYAKHLYTQAGTTPWNSSKSCWEKTILPESEKVLLLQKRVKELTNLLVELQKKTKAAKAKAKGRK